MGAFALLAGVVVPDKTAGYGVIKDVVRDRVEDNLVLKRWGLDQPFLWLINIEQLKLSGAVPLRFQIVR